MHEIHVITTGGTIDVVDPASPARIGFPRVPLLLDHARLTVRVWIDSPFRKDSRDLTTDDRLRIAELVRSSPSHSIVIVHGTDTMLDTARALAPLAEDKTIVLTGAFTPATLPYTDAAFNLGSAVIAAQLLPDGVFIAVGGEVHDYRYVSKSADRRCFERLSRDA